MSNSRKRIFITGIAGFIGFHLAKALEKEGHFVTGCDHFNDYYDPELKKQRAAELPSVHTLDICKRAKLKDLILQNEITHIVHLAAQAGVDLVVGHGPHQMQGIERHGKCLIAYSLGNCVFDQKYEETKIGLVLRAHFNSKKGLVDTDILPVNIPEYIYAPEFFEGSEKERIISELSKLTYPDGF